MTLLTLHHTGMVYGAGWYGKLCTAVIYLSMFVLMLWADGAGLVPVWRMAALLRLPDPAAFESMPSATAGILREARADGARKQA